MRSEQVSYETAKALKDAGYPQPGRAYGQCWYGTRFAGGTEQYNTKCVVGSKGNLMLASNGNGADLIEYPVYIPTLTDLLDHLGPGCQVRALGLGEFECSQDHNPKSIITNNPCEVLADWIVQNAKQA